MNKTVPTPLRGLFIAALDVHQDVPSAVRADVMRSIKDVFASCAAIPDDRLRVGGSPDRRRWVLDAGDRLSTTFENAYRAHLLDFDPVHPRAHGHPIAMLFPALLPYYTAEMCTGEELVAALAAGFETMCVLGELFGLGLRRDGRHPTCVLGAVAVSVAVSRILSRSPEEACQAAAVAASTATGFRWNFGSPAKAYQLALAARNGHAAALAVTDKLLDPSPGGEMQALWRVLGVHAIAGSGKDVRPFGAPWRLEHTPSLHKPLAVCGYLLGAVVGFDRVRAGIAVAVPNIAEIFVRVPEAVAMNTLHGMPTNVEQARFSLGYLLAASLTVPGQDPLDERLLNHAQLRRLAAATSVKHDEEADADAVVRIGVRDRLGVLTNVEVPTAGRRTAPERLAEAETVVRDKWERHVTCKMPTALADRWASAIDGMSATSGAAFGRIHEQAVHALAII